MSINLDNYTNEINQNPDLKNIYSLSLHLQGFSFENLNGNPNVTNSLKKRIDALNKKFKNEFMEIKNGNYSSFIKVNKKKPKKIIQ